MVEKGYDRPLYTLDLIRDPSQTPWAGHYLAVPQGLLAVLRRGLLAEGKKYGTAECEKALAKALPHHARALPQLAELNLDAAWADNMSYWRARMHEKEVERAGRKGDSRMLTKDRRGLRQRGEKLWTSLSDWSALAHLDPPLVSGDKEDMRRLLDGLRQAELRLRDAEFLRQVAWCKLPEDKHAELVELVHSLLDVHDGGPTLDFQRRRAAQELIVIRAALIGDLRRLSKAAKLKLPPGQARGLQMQELLPRSVRRRPPPGAPTDPQPDGLIPIQDDGAAPVGG